MLHALTHAISPHLHSKAEVALLTIYHYHIYFLLAIVHCFSNTVVVTLYFFTRMDDEI